MTVILPCIWFFVFGTAMGSFFNVLIDRLPEGRDVVFGRSSCSDCGTRLRWIDLIPVVSYLMIGGKCRYCGAKLSVWYLISEIAVGSLFAGAFYRYTLSADAVTLAGNIVLWSLLFIIAVMDWKTSMIMDIFSILTAAAGMITGLVSGRGFVQILLGGITGAAFFGLLFFAAKLILKRDGLGLGDIFLLGAVGCWLPWEQVIITAFLTAYVSLPFIFFKAVKEKKIGMKTEFPLGPSICTAAFIMSIWGERISGWISGILFL